MMTRMRPRGVRGAASRSRLLNVGAAAPGHVGVPAVVSSFVGRDAELAAIRATLATERLVTLVGPGGSGKTRLAIEAARRAVFDVGWFVELAGIQESRTVPAAVLADGGFREEPGRCAGLILVATRSAVYNVGHSGRG